MLRGAQIFGFGLLFRVQEFLLGQPYAPWTDLLRVDVLNIIGVSIILMGLMCGLAGLARIDSRARIAERGAAAASLRVAIRARRRLAIAAAIALATPPLWTTHRPALAALVSGVLRERRAQPGRTAALALPAVSLGGIRICGTGVWLPAFFAVGARA